MAPPKVKSLRPGVPGGLREQIKAERARAILGAARDLFRERGFDRATTLEIAERAGVGAGTVFKYFPTKDALLSAVVNMDLAAVHRRAARLATTQRGLAARLVSFYGQILDFHLAHGDLSRAFMRLATAPEEDEGPDAPIRATMGFVAEAALAGELAADVPVADLAQNCLAIFLDVLNQALMRDAAMAIPHERLARRLSLQLGPLGRPAP